MERMRLVVVLLVLLFSFNSSQAQIWQQIKKAAEDKAGKKGQSDSGKAVDQNVNMNDAILNYGKNKVDPSVVPNSYNFSWKYVMEIKTGEGKAMNADYFLEPNAAYFAMNIDQGKGQSMLMIMDSKNNITVTGFGNGKEKMASASKMPDYSEMAKKESEKTKFTIKTLPNKTFLGYNCKGIQMTNDEHDIICYYTSEAKVSFGDMFKNQKGWKMPEAFTNYFKPEDKTLLMDMTMKDLKNKGKVTTMKCVSLEKSAYVFNKADYKFM
ncbi:hypothetical protein B0A75_10700 [Flavobacterium oncorhynchi]|uniref:DUF4412 domain-containing protein n=1 Tax=Flavobacterium oncorhynchi TaxID=728056 RepID=A0A226I1L8_9FLAO|nr:MULTISPECIES: DUF4412 domain-containing protein [Flavobacterium]OXA99601.1 hypothetical protein B0A75_10700 [Flavobacterium oncorhynchi]RXM46055.1 DUF4412 domain-containing protein [Flavobacterium sp. YO64]